MLWKKEKINADIKEHAGVLMYLRIYTCSGILLFQHFQDTDCGYSQRNIWFYCARLDPYLNLMMCHQIYMQCLQNI